MDAWMGNVHDCLSCGGDADTRSSVASLPCMQDCLLQIIGHMMHVYLCVACSLCHA